MRPPICSPFMGFNNLQDSLDEAEENVDHPSIHPHKDSIRSSPASILLLPRALPTLNSLSITSNMCCHRWFPVTPKGCTASNSHVVMRKETIFCNEAIDRSLQQCEVDHNEQSAQKEVGTLRHGGSAMFLACVGETVKVIDSFNRIIKEMPIQALNTHCPCCAGEMTMANALLVITRDPDSVSVVI